MICPNFEKCKFFSSFGNQKCAEALVMLYCKGDFKECARYKLKQEGKEPPANLWPNGQIV